MSVADPKKFVAGWCIIVLAGATAILGLARNSGGALGGGILFAICAGGFVADAKRKNEVPPRTPGLRWHHVALVAAVVALGVAWLYNAFVL